MKEEFHKKDIIPKEQMKSLLVRNNHPALFRFSFMIFSFLIMNGFIIWSWDTSILLFIVPSIIYGIICCSIFASLHETAHGTAFRTNSLNKTSAIISGFFHFYPPSLFRELHFMHHRHTHVPGKDPEISMGDQPAPSVLSNAGIYTGWLSGLPLMLFKLFMIISGCFGMPEFIRKKIFPFVHPKKRKIIFIECLLFMIGYALIFYVLMFFDFNIWAILIGQLVGHIILAFYLSMEHNGLPHEGNIFNKTRSINTNKWIKLIMWNMPYHAEHHAFPAIPFHALPDLNKAIEPHLIHKKEGHVDFHRKVIQNF